MAQHSLTLPSPRQSGFTLVEMMVASTIGLFVIAVMMTVFYQTASMGEVISGQMYLNQQAREMFRMMGDGGFYNDGAGNIYAVPGMRGTVSDRTYSDNTALQYYMKGLGDGTPEYRMQLGDLVNSGRKIQSSEISPITISCTGTNTPVYGCTAGGSKTVYGYLANIKNDEAATPKLIKKAQDTAVNNTATWVVAPVTLINPYMQNRKYATSADLTEVYPMMFSQEKHHAYDNTPTAGTGE